jgi:hypothetical protein
MRTAVLRLQVFMQELNGDGALTYCGGDPFDGPVPHVPGGSLTVPSNHQAVRGIDFM